MVDFVALTEPAQDRDRFLDAGLIDDHRLKTALERRILLDVFAILVERGGTDAVELTARQHRLQQVAGVHRTFGGARADHRVQLVDEEDDFARRLDDFLQHRLQPLFEFSTKLCARDQRSHIERDHTLALQALGHVAPNDAMSQSLDDRGLADAGLADQHGIVLGASGENLDHPTDFLVAADDWINFALRGELGEIAPVALERLVSPLWVRARHALVTAHLAAAPP